MLVAGLDGWKNNWIAVVLDESGFQDVLVVHDLAAFAADQQELALIAIDIPIVLAADGRRRCDDEARARIGPRRSSVFFAPALDLVSFDDYVVANAHAKHVHGRGISRQAFALLPKIAVARSVDDARLFEVHPEVSFRAMAGEPISHAKKTWAGHHERLRLLDAEDVRIPRDLGLAGGAGPDDVLDAAAAAWSARRRADGAGEFLPADAAPGEPRIWF